MRREAIASTKSTRLAWLRVCRIHPCHVRLEMDTVMELGMVGMVEVVEMEHTNVVNQSLMCISALLEEPRKAGGR